MLWSHIFLLNAVMSREALMMRSRRSWCSSSSLRKLSNMGMKGEGFVDIFSFSVLVDSQGVRISVWYMGQK